MTRDATIDVERLTFIDLNSEKHGSFVHSENLDKFLATPLGEAQTKSMIKEMQQQMLGQGVRDYEPTTSQIRRALFSEQAAQDVGREQGLSRRHDVTNEKMLEDNGPEWYEKIGSLVASFFKATDDGIKEGAKTGVDATVDGVKNNDGMLGNAARAVDAQNRQQMIEQQVSGAVSGGPGGMR